MNLPTVFHSEPRNVKGETANHNHGRRADRHVHKYAQSG